MRRALFQAVGLVLVALLLGLASKWLHPRAPAWSIHSEPLLEGEIDVAGVEELYAGDVLWIDARRAEEYAAGHIPGALLINPQDAESQLFDHFEVIQVTVKPVVVYCGKRACQASKKIASYLGESTILDPIYVLKGGWPAWVELGGEVE